MRRHDREITDRTETLAILAAADTCHIALNTSSAPYIVPLNFGYRWEGEFPELFFHGAATGRKLNLIAVDNRAGFAIDTGHELVTGNSACSWGMKYASIIGTGLITQITTLPEKQQALDLIMKHYGSQQEHHDYDVAVFGQTVMFRLTVLEMSAKRKQ